MDRQWYVYRGYMSSSRCRLHTCHVSTCHHTTHTPDTTTHQNICTDTTSRSLFEYNFNYTSTNASNKLTRYQGVRAVLISTNDNTYLNTAQNKNQSLWLTLIINYQCTRL